MNAIEVESLSKIYRLGYTGTGSLKDDLRGAWARIRGKENPNAVIASVNDRTDSRSDGYVYALKDISFSVREGEVLGIIGKNGAGKSTLLKILTKVTGPTTGTIRMRGRVGSLLEVGTGFNPELSGRENIYLNGAILGMKKREIDAKFFDIVEFAGVAKYVDTPVKRYSSGMRVRLGFGVAAFLEPEILIVDEVLAVGDAEFQKRAIGKMKDVSQEGKRTVLFVSHNMASVKTLCTTGIVLERGGIKFNGSADDAVDFYLQNREYKPSARQWTSEDAPGNDKVKLLNVRIEDTSGAQNFHIDSELKVTYELENRTQNSTLGTTIRIKNSREEIVFSDGRYISPDKDSMEGIYRLEVRIPAKLLNSDKYTIDLLVGENARYLQVHEENVLGFEILFGGKIRQSKRLPGIIYQELDWNLEHRPF